LKQTNLRLVSSNEFAENFECKFKLSIEIDHNDKIAGIVEWIVIDNLENKNSFTSRISIRNNEIVSYLTLQKNNYSYPRNVSIYLFIKKFNFIYFSYSRLTVNLSPIIALIKV
jgi:hypothetical protein